jgi:L-arabinokinase
MCGLVDTMSNTISQMTAESAAQHTLGRLHRHWPELSETPRSAWVARVPGGLDVMGGIAESSGALTLTAPTEPAVHVAVAPRDDQRVRVAVAHKGDEAGGRDNGHAADMDWSLSTFYSANGQVIPAEEMRKRCREISCRTRAAALAAMHALLAGRHAPHLGGGANFLIDSELAGRVDCRAAATIQGAVLAALTSSLSLSLDGRQQALIVQQALQNVLGVPCGPSTVSGTLLSSPGKLLQVWCRPFEVGEPLDLPEGVTIVGIDCGAQHAAAQDRCVQARTAALMGASIIRRIIETSRGAAPWEGYLARVSVTDYVDRFRDRLPTKLKGSAFLEKFGPLDDVLAPIDPAATYKIRSRAEHHIYEDDRVQQFAERLRRAARTHDEQCLHEAGELMYASHWSYGQRCGLGSIESDQLVNQLREEGREHAVYGARVSGIGSGGSVVVLLRDDPAAHAAVERAIDAYERKCGKKAQLQPMSARGGLGLSVTRSASA